MSWSASLKFLFRRSRRSFQGHDRRRYDNPQSSTGDRFRPRFARVRRRPDSQRDRAWRRLPAPRFMKTIPIRGLSKLPARCETREVKHHRDAGSAAGRWRGCMKRSRHSLVKSSNAWTSTGAGDCFVGAVAARTALGAPIEHALRYANVAASICVQRPGRRTVNADRGRGRRKDGIARPTERS